MINLSENTISIACHSLRETRRQLTWQLEVSIPGGKVNPAKKEVIEHQLEEVESALTELDAFLDSLYQ